MLSLLLVGMLTLIFNVQLVKSDATPPTINILSPENKTYYIPPPGEIIIAIYPPPSPQICIPLNFTVDEMTSWIGYSLNGQANVTVFRNTTLVGLLPGTYCMIIYGNDTYGNMGSSENVYFAVKILGDINGDGIIDIMDLLIIALAYGSQPGDPHWDPDADINNDEIVDIMDAVIIGVNFGKTWFTW